MGARILCERIFFPYDTCIFCEPSFPTTLESRMIEQCAMQSKIPYLGKKGGNRGKKKELLSSSERHEKTKKHQTLPEEATPTTFVAHRGTAPRVCRFHKSG